MRDVVRSPGRHGRFRSQRAGYSLIEVLIAMAILGAVFSALALGVITVMRTSRQANDVQRAGAALTSFGEVIKQLPYQVCADADDYNAQFEAWEQALDPERRLQQSNAGVVVTVTGVENGCANGGEDQNWHAVNILAESNGVIRESQIAKRRNEPPPMAIAVLGVEAWSEEGDPLVGYAVNGIGSNSPNGIVAFEYTCDSEGANPQPFVVYEEDDPSAECVFEAPLANEQPHDYVIRLVVSDSRGSMSTDRHTVTVQPRTPQAPGPTVVLPTTSTTSTTTTAPGAPTTTVVETYPPMVTGITKGNANCCWVGGGGAVTWSRFSWDAQPGISLYRITLRWSVNPGMGTFVEDFRPGLEPDGYTTSGDRHTARFQRVGLSLPERYTVSIQAGVDLPGGGIQWGGIRYLCNGAAVRLNSTGCP